ncbi:nuclear transport factor 2 family protein [Nocardioides sp. Kera G14]|uniref:nuclear transport factor 2 family protein n=1 Tax=Nocardioides sp. Kera G14 TaxID=2884264 RepID=UPI001D126108|nr:nuclear transport factor 2 family protein [Nocardioides sp. Kera G14]UDY24793.1 nuclear transport factor 2 family protein [Nocardioides sp. Kera G14]
MSTELPPVIEGYLAAHDIHDADGAISFLTDDVVVVDDGRIYRGADEVRGWLARAASEFEYTSTLTSVERVGESQWTAIHHLEGNFPGSPVDLAYRFTVTDALISALTIEVA